MPVRPVTTTGTMEATAPSLRKVLVANRGEIAVRVIQACRDIGVRSVAIYSDADRSARHVGLADESVCIGPASATKSYLNQEAVLTAAEITGATALHPGYGFLAENANFAERVAEAGLVWIGPEPETIRLLGDKAQARKAAHMAGVPVLPGTIEPPATSAQALASAQEIGFPVLLKAVSGGGGKGMRVVERARDLERLFDLASREAAVAFGDPRVYVERFLAKPRHIEVQVFGEVATKSTAAVVLELGTRECSIQRRHQKLLEEAPPTGIDQARLDEIGAAAVRLATSVGYRGAGTVEFLVDERDDFFFMEMNTRIQVEHPVTELVTSTDLVVAQLRCAQGRRSDLPARVEIRGHSIECRLNAEDPASFVPSPGRIERLRWPTGPGVRVDSHVYQGYDFPPFYDSLLGKIIVWGRDRPEAIARMSRALEEFELEGIATTAALHRTILRDERFAEGVVDTGFLERLLR